MLTEWASPFFFIFLVELQNDCSILFLWGGGSDQLVKIFKKKLTSNALIIMHRLILSKVCGLWLQSPERQLECTEPVCDFCLQTSQYNRKGEQEDLLICRDCGNKGTEEGWARYTTILLVWLLITVCLPTRFICKVLELG